MVGLTPLHATEFLAGLAPTAETPVQHLPADPLSLGPQSQCQASIDWTKLYLDVSATVPLPRACLILLAPGKHPSTVVWTRTTENRARLFWKPYYGYKIC